MSVIACDLAALVPFVPSPASPWDAGAVLHLHRRLGYGLSPVEVSNALTQNPVQHTLAGLRAAAAAPNLPEPPWAYYSIDDYASTDELAQNVIDWRSTWVSEMRNEPWRSKMVLFWHNHFVTAINKYQCPSWMWQYHEVLQTYAFGDFREFVRAIGTTPAMLVYLDGVLSTRFDANENYARELFELFTLGEGNGYTQSDITEAARALTGYNGYTTACAPINYVPQFHDPGVKTIFGQTGNFDYDDLIDLLFSQRAVEVSNYICGRLYRHFVSPDIDTTIVAQLAATLRANSWSLLAVYEQLFSSAHFFSPPLYGVRVKDPFEFVVGSEELFASDALSSPTLTTAVWYVAGNLGQLLFELPDVAGWPGNRAWINANTISLRYEGAEQVIYLIYIADRLALSAWARTLDIVDESDVAEVTCAIVDFVLPQGLPTQLEYDNAVAAMRGEVPSYYFENNLWDLDFEYAPEQIASLLVYLFRRPEYQLC